MQLFVAAQFSVNGQLIQRTELRNGYNKIIDKSQDPAVFIGQRMRLAGAYQADSLKLYVALQDIRIWGSAPVNKVSDNLFSLYEGWAQININKYLKIKLGRQELRYDNARFLGSLDWGFQGRSHDFALIKYETAHSRLHAGGGYNQDAQTLSNAVYSVPNNYQNAQLLNYQGNWKNFNIAALFWNNGLQHVAYDSLGKVKERAIYYSQTYGISNLQVKIKNTTICSFGYYQAGYDIKNKVMNGYDLGLLISHTIVLKDSVKRYLKIIAGGEMLSGTRNNFNGNLNRSFSPLYGTNHGFNGFMDMYYVGGRHENSVGLNDIFLTVNYTISDKVFITLDAHAFSAHADVYDATKTKMNKNLGQELDLTFGYTFNKSLSLQGGYSQYFSTSTLNYLHKVIDPKPLQNWAYLMLIVKINR